jgi:hypothetical protein
VGDAWLFLCAFIALGYSSALLAADVASFATGGCARGIRSEELLGKMSNGTGKLTKEEWIDFHEKIFAMLDEKRPASSMRANTSAPAVATS